MKSEQQANSINLPDLKLSHKPPWQMLLKCFPVQFSFNLYDKENLTKSRSIDGGCGSISSPAECEIPFKEI